VAGLAVGGGGCAVGCWLCRPVWLLGMLLLAVGCGRVAVAVRVGGCGWWLVGWWWWFGGCGWWLVVVGLRVGGLWLWYGGWRVAWLWLLVRLYGCGGWLLAVWRLAVGALAGCWLLGCCVVVLLLCGCGSIVVWLLVYGFGLVGSFVLGPRFNKRPGVECCSAGPYSNLPRCLKRL